MLTEIRDRATGWIAWIIVTIISIPFVLWGVNEYFTGGGSLNVAVVNGQEISQQQYRAALEERRNIARRMMGAQFDADVVNSPEFRNAVLNDLINRQLLDQDAESAGYRVSDAQLAEFITTSSQFQREGQFDPGLYQQQLMTMGLTKTGYESYLRDEFVLQQMRDGLGGSSIVTAKDRQDALALAQETRVFDHVTLDPASFATEVEVTEEEIESRYDENQEQYQSPEMVRIQYVQLSVDDLSAAVEVTEEDIQRFYEDNRELYKTEEQRTASHILLTVASDADDKVIVETLAKATQLADRARGGEDFAELAKEHSQDPGSAAMGGDLGQIGRGLMVKPFEDVLFALETGEVSDPVKTRYGYHIIKLTDLVPEKGKELEEVRDEIIEEERKRAAEGLFVDRAETFRNLVFEQPETLDIVAEELGLELEESDWFPLDSGTGIAENATVREVAFGDDVFIENLNSETIELDINTLVALRKLETKPAAVKPLEEVRAEIEEAIRAEKSRARVYDAGAGLLAQLQEGGDWDDLTAENQLTPIESTQTRMMANPDTSIAVSKEVFRTELSSSGPVYGSVLLPSGGYALFRLKEVRPGEADTADEATVQQISNSLDRRRGLDYFTSYQSGLRDTAKIEIFEENL
ncbi:SurA N-terminal domain-containing protein [Pseudomonadota bacterium]